MIFNISMTYLQKIEYNEIRSDKQIVYWYILFCDKKYYKDILKDYPELKMVVKKMNDLENNDEFRGYVDHDEFNRVCAKRDGIELGIEQGKLEEKNNMIQNMLKNSIPDNIIMSCANVSKNKLDEIRQMMFN